MQKGSCCPKQSWPRLQVDYEAKGEKLEIANTTCYHVGTGDKALLLVSDIFGATSGKHETVADTFASFGYNVYLPELLTSPYQGEMDMEKIVANIKEQNNEKMKQRFAGMVKELELKGHKRFYCLGFCYGLWFAFKMAAEFDNIICIGGFHPSLGVQQIFGGNQVELTKRIKCPAFLYPAQNDPPNVKTGGELIQILQERFGKDKVGTHEFPDMIHGWTVRGDIKDQKVKRDCEKAIEMCKQYFSRFA